MSIEHSSRGMGFKAYEDLVKRCASGPQLEGLIEESYEAALHDSRSMLTRIEGAEWLVAIPIEYHQDYRKEFFETHFPDREVYYMSLPDSDDIDVSQLQGYLEELSSRGALVVYDYMAGSDDLVGGLTSRYGADCTPVTEAYGREYGLPSVKHFTAIAERSPEATRGGVRMSIIDAIKSLESPELPENGVAVLSPHCLSRSPEILDEIWGIYSQQFEHLVEDHPSLQIQPREELERMLLDDSALNIACFEDGSVVALGYLVYNMEKCVWLDAAYYEDRVREKDKEVDLAYFPGIVVESSRAQQGGGYVDSIIKKIEDVYERSDRDGMQIVFQCTNVSETYIPKIVTDVIEKNGVFSFGGAHTDQYGAFKNFAEYKYRVKDLS
ncbi:hypothetical protein H6796_02330 [Candidatus Nomurabacteria bacterium]|nr:hypothetical protein [Candidatus Nomurabacteria bacterium]